MTTPLCRSSADRIVHSLGGSVVCSRNIVCSSARKHVPAETELIKFFGGSMTEPGAGSPHIVWYQFLDSRLVGEGEHRRVQIASVTRSSPLPHFWESRMRYSAGGLSFRALTISTY